MRHPDYSMGKVSFLSQGSSRLKYQGLPGIALAPPGRLVSPFTPAPVQVVQARASLAQIVERVVIERVAGLVGGLATITLLS